MLIVRLIRLAELCAVIVVSCMPSIPQFFRFVNGKKQPPISRAYPNTANDSKRPLASSSKGSAKITYVDPETGKHEVSGRYLQLEEY